jgi:hypothetical protein
MGFTSKMAVLRLGGGRPRRHEATMYGSESVDSSDGTAKGTHTRVADAREDLA